MSEVPLYRGYLRVFCNTHFPQRGARPLVIALPWDPGALKCTLDKVELVRLFQIGRLAVDTLKTKQRDSDSPLFLKLVFRSVVPTLHSPPPSSDIRL